jgi:hypothetical protein
VLSFNAAGAGPFDAPVWNIRDIVEPDLYAGGEGIGVLRAEIAYENNVLTIRELAAASPITDRLQLGCHGAITMNAQTDANLFCDFTNTSFDPYFKFVGRDLPFNRAIASGSVNVAGPLRESAASDGHGTAHRDDADVVQLRPAQQGAAGVVVPRERDRPRPRAVRGHQHRAHPERHGQFDVAGRRI